MWPVTEVTFDGDCLPQNFAKVGPTDEPEW